VVDISRSWPYASVPPGKVAVIGDMTNDLSMFNVAGLPSNTEDEFIRAVTDYILPRAPRHGGAT
jgi:hydroxymethylpyrimidine pyrophosphatase-like HAD family hydrolase